VPAGQFAALSVAMVHGSAAIANLTSVIEKGRQASVDEKKCMR
jgi:hypothetical protein